MRYLALATDYDGTLATDGKVDTASLRILQAFKDSGRKLIMVTGRELEDLMEVFPEYKLFDLIVVENGAVLYDPSTRQETLLAPKANPQLIGALKKRKAKPLSAGRCIVATREPHQTDALEAIRELGLELHVIFNKGAVMILPSGINKRTGLVAALERLGLASQDVVGVGDAENDHAFLSECGFAVAVANALDSLKTEVDLVTEAARTEGVVELMTHILRDDLADVDLKSKKRRIVIGRDNKGRKIRIPARDSCILIAGPSGGGKTSVTTALLERVALKGYQFCVIDPEGDYAHFPDSVQLGAPNQVPRQEEVLQLLERFQNPVVNLLGLPLADRPTYFSALLGRIQELRVRTGRPHWLVLDEAHHLFPAQWKPASLALPTSLQGAILVTVHPAKIARDALNKVDVVLAVGDSPGETLRDFGGAIGKRPGPVPKAGKEKLDVIAWFRRHPDKPFRLHLHPGTVEHDRHQRKYAHGDLEEDSFYFRGPRGALNLRVQNLNLFIQIGQGVDDETWMYHLRNNDYSRWIRSAMRDKGLARKVEKVENNRRINARASREAITAAINKTYTAAA